MERKIKQIECDIYVALEFVIGILNAENWIIFAFFSTALTKALIYPIFPVAGIQVVLEFIELFKRINSVHITLIVLKCLLLPILTYELIQANSMSRYWMMLIVVSGFINFASLILQIKGRDKKRMLTTPRFQDLNGIGGKR